VKTSLGELFGVFEKVCEIKPRDKTKRVIRPELVIEFSRNGVHVIGLTRYPVSVSAKLSTKDRKSAACDSPEMDEG
jgi:hypothetical protein